MTGMRVRSLRLALALLLIPSILSIAGCFAKSKKVSVSGKVTCKGEAVGWGNVRFFSPDGTLWSSTSLKPDGSFTATDVPQGEVQVALQALPIPPAAKQNKQKKDSSSVPVDEFVSFPGKFVAIPPKYQDPKTSELRFTIGSGDNQLDIQLQ